MTPTSTLSCQQVAILYVAKRGHGADISSELNRHGQVRLCANNPAVEQVLDTELSDWGCFTKDGTQYTVKAFIPDTLQGVDVLDGLEATGQVAFTEEVPLQLIN